MRPLWSEEVRAGLERHNVWYLSIVDRKWHRSVGRLDSERVSVCGIMPLGPKWLVPGSPPADRCEWCDAD